MIIRCALLWLLISISFWGCGGKDYPQVVYPPRNPYFSTPDFVIELPPISLLEPGIVELGEIQIPKPSAQLVVKGSLSHPLREEALYSTSIGVFFSKESGEPNCSGLAFPELAEQEGLPRYEIHFLGPARAGKYRLMINTLTADPKDNATRAKGTATVAKGA